MTIHVFSMVKECQACGNVHMIRPETARFISEEDAGLLAGWYWECLCGNTMFEALK